MASLPDDRIKETATVSGTGAITLTGAVAGYVAFSTIYTNNDVMTYVILNLTDNTWEIGRGTYNSGANTITRTTVKRSSNSNTTVTFAAGVFVVYNSLSATELSTSGGAGLIPLGNSSGTLNSSWLPNPGASNLGGIQSIAAVSHKFIDSISTLGVPHQSQPGVADLSDGVTGTGLVVLGTSPTLSNPTVGTQTFGDNSTLAASTAFVTSAINNYIADAITKVACKYKTTAALAANTYNNGSSGVGATLTGNANGAISVDGSTPSVADRILVNSEVATVNNGIYVVTTVGSGGTPYVLTRATDFDTTAKVLTSDTVFVSNGTANGGTTWTMITSGSVTIGTTAITFTQVAGPGTYAPGTGLTLTGSTFNVNASQTQITAVGTLSSLTVTGSTTAGSFLVGTLGYATTNALLSVQSSVNSYNQLTIQNTNSGTTASGDIVVANDVSTNTTFYGNFGINSSGFTGSGSLNLPSATYLTSTSGDLVIGTTTSNNIHFVVNGATTDALKIDTSQNATFAGLVQTSALGSAAAPAMAVGGTSGMWSRSSGNCVDFSAGGANILELFASSPASFVSIASTTLIAWAVGAVGTTGGDLFLGRRGPANLCLGTYDTATPIAQTISVQSAVTNSNVAGADWSLQGSLSTGTAIPGNVVYKQGFSGVIKTAASVTVTSASPAVVALAAHGFVPGQAFTFGGTTAPTGTTLGTTYFVIATGLTVNTFQFSATAGGTAINTSSTGTTVTLTTLATTQNVASTVLTIGSSGLTGSQATSLFSSTVTWNTTGTPTADYQNIIDIASNASSLLFDRQVGGSSKFSIDKSGNVIIAGNITLSAKNIVTDTTTGTKIGTSTSQKIGFYNATPIVQPTGDIATALTNLGLVGTPTLSMDKLTSNTLAAGVGMSATSYSAGTFSSGTYTPATTNGNFQHATNNGAHTLAPPSTVCTLIIEYVNGASAGTITTSGFTKVTGDALTTTNGSKFHFYITKGNAYSSLNVVALQ